MVAFSPSRNEILLERCLVQKLILAREAMATRFEFVLTGDDAVRMRAAGEEALDEISRIESQLSLYKMSSELAQVNAGAWERPIRVSPPVFELLLKARELSRLSGGTFDITVAPLVRCWGFMKGSGTSPTDEEIRTAHALVGMEQVELDESVRTVRFRRGGMMLDLGSIGKGYALDVAAEILREGGIENALLHGGTSTIYAMGSDSECSGWKVAVEQPPLPSEAPSKEREVLAVVELKNEALSVSAPSGKYFVVDGKTYGHVIDPRTGCPAADALLGCAIVKTATESDALSTAVLLASEIELEQLSRSFPLLRYLQTRVNPTATGIRILVRGVEASSPERVK
jgi:FAD:protein FMN transferase